MRSPAPRPDARRRPRGGVLLLLAGLLAGLAGGPRALAAQDVPTVQVDSLAVEGNARVTAPQVLATTGIVLGSRINYRDVQRALTALMATGQYDDAWMEQRTAAGRLVLVVHVVERPLLQRWVVEGAQQVTTGAVRDRIKVREGQPIDRDALARSLAAIDSLYVQRSMYGTTVEAIEEPLEGGGVRVTFRITEGSRLAVSGVQIDGNTVFPDARVVGEMGTRPEGFWWFQKGDYDEARLRRDIDERLPEWYASQGYLDFRVVSDTLIPEPGTGKGVLHLTVEEGRVYEVGTFDIQGSRRFSTEELAGRYPFGRRIGEPPFRRPFDRSAWEAATSEVRDLYTNNGYIYAQVQPVESRRTREDGTAVVDLQWNIREGPPATINKIVIVGNDVTHERVIREAIVMAPGMVFNRDALLRSYQNVSNLGFFQQPMPPPDIQPTANGVDVDVIFRVEERRTGNINFGASLGQGTGIGGFIGLEEPNMFGKAKRGRLQWQFGKNVNDFTLGYTDPALRGGRISASITVFNSRQRYTIGDLGRREQTGGLLQLGFPVFTARYTRLYTSYGYQRISYSEGSDDLRERFRCENCVRSTFGLNLVRDTRVGLPFATGGTYASTSLEFNGGPFLGGTGDFRKVDLEGRWYTPLGAVGGEDGFGQGITFVLGITGRTGFIFGDAGPFFTELYSLGGTQYGIPLRGYDEFSITPDGFDPTAGGSAANPESFGQSYALFGVEAGARLSQSLYLNAFFDAGNVYRTSSQFDPTRLFRGAGVGAALISPLGPIGVDLAYGFDKVDRFGSPDPGWKVHFRVGNFF